MTTKILVIDDDETIRVMLKVFFELEGMECLEAENGQVALLQIRNQLPDLILLDLQMPIMDGWEFARQFRSAISKTIPILIMSGVERAKLQQSKLAVDGYIEKPFDLDRMIALVRRTLSIKDCENKVPQHLTSTFPRE
jgi:DNA-binding response OmpR family regulator